MHCQICFEPVTSDFSDGLCCQCQGLLRWFRGYLAVFDPTTITAETTFKDLGCDSLDYIDWQIEAEVHFDVRLTTSECENVRTVGDFLKNLRLHNASWPDSKTIVLQRHGRFCTTYSWQVVDTSV